jgi:uncharacterized protein (TIGR03089 family)
MGAACHSASLRQPRARTLRSVESQEFRDIWQLLSSFPDPQRPFITTNFTDTGRIELSVTTFRNGAAKSANAFRDVIDAEPGTDVQVDLGWTWQQAVWQAGALISGNYLVTQSPEVRIIPAGQSGQTGSIEVFGISTDGWGRPQGCEGEITAEVLGQPDGWMYPEFFEWQLEIVESARQWGLQRGVSTGVRIGIDTGNTEPSIFIPFLLPLVFSGSVVLSDNLDERLIEQEQITCVLA